MAKTGSVAVLTGREISVESEASASRDVQTGLWARWRPEDLATPQAFRRNPRLVWDWYRWRRELARDAQPGAEHLALAELERRFSRFHLATQSVDGLHRRAGSRNLSELRGNLFQDLCAYEGTEVEPTGDAGELPPRCPRCGGPVRPGVVWFGEQPLESAMREAKAAAENCDIYLVVGTSGMAPPEAGLPAAARRAGAFVVEIDPGPAPSTDSAHLSLRGGAGAVLASLLGAFP